MSESNRTSEDSRSESSEKSRDERADFHISNKINFSSNPLDLNNRTDTTGSRANVYSCNLDSRGEKNEGHNQMIDLLKLLQQLSFARVVLKRLPISTEATKLRITDDLAPIDEGVLDQAIDVNAPRNEHIPPSEHIDADAESHADSVAIVDTCDIVDDAEQKFADKSVATHRRQNYTDLIKRNCPECKIMVAGDKIKRKQLMCTQCGIPLKYQCAQCDKQYDRYENLVYHFNTRCNVTNSELKCPMCDFRTAAKYLMNRHSTYCLSKTIYSCSHCEFKTKVRSNLYVHMQIEHEDKSTATSNSEERADLIRRYCPKCKTLVAAASISSKRLCAKCGTPLSYQCVRCDKQYNSYSSIFDHLNTVCNAQNLDLKCPNCPYQTHSTKLMNVHLRYCLSENNFSCDLCEYTTRKKMNLLRHMTTMHNDILKIDCFQCKTKSKKCKQCRNKVPICETCHVGFSSTDNLQEHQKSCKPPVLECKYCPYQTIDDIKLRKHIKLEHFSALMSQN